MKKTVLFLILGTLSFYAAAQTSKESYQLSTHILDVQKGSPASGVTIVLYRQNSSDDSWIKIDEGITDRNGRIADFLSHKNNNEGIYKLRFETASYFRKQKETSIYPFIEVVFQIRGNGHYHIPLTVSANGYSTYRGN
ncbi:MAG: hydroxyisourate hydrolase [Spirochaetia bacterium]|nr:hydroxyisourate hydrolase [Spirochaetia bacterium]